MKSLITLALSLIPWSGYRTYVAALIAVVVGAFMLWSGDVGNGAELIMVAVMFFFKRASDDKLMNVLLEKVNIKEPTFPSHKYPGGPNDAS